MAATDVQDAGSTLDPAEVEKFSRIAAEWWDPFGKFRPLHKFNPARLAYIRDAACAHFARERRGKRPLEGLRLLDVGCGGGLVAEPMRRLGAEVVGLDASERNIAVASTHARQQGLDIDYRAGTIEALLASGEAPFDIVLNLEAVEHVADPALFLSASAQMVKPGGFMVVATINRTLKAFALAKIGAEYVLGWLPKGTHDPRRFMKPEELKAALSQAGLAVTAVAGVAYSPLMDLWRVTDDADVNYMVTAVKPGLHDATASPSS
ncbi:MAG TPA: bifunctional 2-polyprenyl-6-hydroxyphenol methylase/3-demethylubiquinol 3-O-methyltransferase UbiG [Parvularculaceae bacterium]|nr:bifunctional 2-polyprenyl-6-hydroxyphenol methylase/3-demethylubiquinol 3-O-methyltransferase UbiG [Amphiplicatus sp.]MCB9954284.1 bifunctional 2-polyprenyl-6-hydroxyphenol methylase/3-demethylubiquinol 3-O-methyltransferase UbiG [Caulobacterales bacterium]HOP19406.1 bifunctional 2-polyprenyl-6-hydroxyphenol methylase/3-demethylubiquinol 3-O-methyltransferase UbiG [Amphiplicatus sp.]HPE29983.1 bifunctional 2-polyprenyl-6-hydroxyphenol methylase/3-demethylubiquinol 3-O-methyltransferase UbiG [